MKVTPLETLSDILLIEPQVFKDDRGFFFESFQAKRYAEHGISANFVQDNLSRSTKNVLRGLHYQLKQAQGKLIGVTRGKIMDIAVDIRHGSPTFGRHVSIILGEQNSAQLYIPPGFAHGFCVLSDVADFYYKCTDYYYPAEEHGIRWDDPDIKIDWPIDSPILSPKDSFYPLLKEIPITKLPRYENTSHRR